MKTSWIIFQILVGYNLVLPLFLYLCYSFKRNRNRSTSSSSKAFDYAIIVTFYGQAKALDSVLDSLLNLNYRNYHVYVVLDNCKGLDSKFSHPKVSVLIPESILASNLKSHFYAIDRFERQHEILTIIDSDNLVDPEYLHELNNYFEIGFEAVQGVRRAKNLNTTIACLDAARDMYYNFYDGEVLYTLGSSSTLAGSGMAFKTNLYKECVEHLEVIGAGFDKVLQAQLLTKGYRIAYAPKAIVYDEKTTDSNQLVDQRSRWIYTWFKYVRYGLELLLLGIKNRNFNQSLFGAILLRPPLFLFILVSVICLGLNIFYNSSTTFIWMAAFLIFKIGFIIALKKQSSDTAIYKSLAYIPKFIFFQVVSLFYSRLANKRSIATKRSNLNSVQ